MSRFIFMKWSVVAILAGVTLQVASAADVDPCTQFKWDVSRELAVMRQSPQAITAAVKPDGAVPQIKLGALYTVKLADQTVVRFVTNPAKLRMADGVTAGLVRVRVAKAARYRVSITSGHWVDIIDADQTLKSLDFQGHVGCERPRKIVEYELPADRELTLQLSGAKDAEVTMAVTAVSTGAAN